MIRPWLLANHEKKKLSHMDIERVAMYVSIYFTSRLQDRIKMYEHSDYQMTLQRGSY